MYDVVPPNIHVGYQSVCDYDINVKMKREQHIWEGFNAKKAQT